MTEKEPSQFAPQWPDELLIALDEFVKSQKPMPPAFQKVVNENFWNLLHGRSALSETDAIRKTALEDAMREFRHEGVYTGVEVQNMIRALKNAAEKSTLQGPVSEMETTASRVAPATAAPSAIGTIKPHPNTLWVVWYEDKDKQPEVFFGEGAEANARLRYKQAYDNWSCHLLVRVPTSNPAPEAELYASADGSDAIQPKEKA